MSIRVYTLQLLGLVVLDVQQKVYAYSRKKRKKERKEERKKGRKKVVANG